MQFTLEFLNLLGTGVWLSLPLLLLFTLVILFIGQIAGRIECWTKFDTFYWTFITAFTVGYGDIRPVKKVTKILSLIIALLGIMFTGGIVAITVSAASISFERNIKDFSKTDPQKALEDCQAQVIKQNFLVKD